MRSHVWVNKPWSGLVSDNRFGHLLDIHFVVLLSMNDS